MLGKALGIPENSVRTYAEAEIRAGYGDIFLSYKFLKDAMLHEFVSLLFKTVGKKLILVDIVYFFIFS